MKLIKKLKALFIKDEQPISLDLKAAEIKEGRAYLHPKNTDGITYRVKSDDIEIRLGKGKSLTDKDIYVITEQKNKAQNDPKLEAPANIKKDKSDPNSSLKPSENTSAGAMIYDTSRFKKKIFTVALYPEEYDRLMSTIQKYGYKRAEFIMASADTATKGTMARAQQKIKTTHTKIRKEERALKQKHPVKTI